ncbi:MAG: type 4a pilus biogenesis protein PilO [Candidatus Roizmanbacteria bacterium]|nr:MAG: type 4a pilus biogenesis protein PilO [Candidatus Roizmanbacteria bacterium]
MAHTNIVNKLFTKKTKDYSFTIVFFIIFSFFTFFVIKPNLTIVFSLQKDLGELKKVDSEYERAIIGILSVQSALEKNRESFPLLNFALPATPLVNQVIDDVKKAASDSGLILGKADINQVSLKESKPNSKNKFYSINISTTSDFKSVEKFINTVIQQRRLKAVKNLSITKDEKESTNSSSLQIKLEIEGSYL